MVEKVGFVGLGIMGASMAGNLLEAGHELVVHNRTRNKAEQLVARGASVADSPREVAENSAIIITMLPGPPEVEEVLAGEGGLLEGTVRGSLIVDMSTSSPVLARELAHTARERCVGMLDAPVSGGDLGARDGTLSIMVGGEEDDFERARPLFEVMGKTVVHVGETGTGQVVKACNQIMVALVIEAVAEALVLGSKAGVAPDRVVEILSRGLAANKVLEVKGEKFLSHDFTPGGKVEYHHKDLGIALAAGREYGVTLPVTALVDQMFGVLEAKGKATGITRLCSPSSRRAQRTEQRDRRQQVDERQRRRVLRGVRPDDKRTVHRRSDRRQEDYVIGRRRWIWQLDDA